MKTQPAPERALKTIREFQKETCGAMTVSGETFTEIVSRSMKQYAAGDEYVVLTRSQHKNPELMATPDKTGILEGINPLTMLSLLEEHKFIKSDRNDGAAVSGLFRSWMLIPVTIKKEIFLAVVIARKKGRFTEAEAETARQLGYYLTSALKDIRSRNKKANVIMEETRHRFLLRTQASLERKQTVFPGFFQAIDYSACTGSDMGQTFRNGENIFIACLFDITADDANRQIGLVYLDTWFSILSQTTLDLRGMLARLNSDMVQRVAECYASASIVRYNRKNAQIELAGTGSARIFFFCHDTMSVDTYTFGAAAGIRDELDIPANTIPVKPGDIVCLCTDGLTETRKGNGELFGNEAMSELIRKNYFLSAGDLAGKILKTVAETGASEVNKDDRTLQILKIE